VIADAALLLAANCCFLVAGIGVSRAFGLWTGRPSVKALGLVYLSGFAAYGVLAQLLLVLGLPLTAWQVVAICVVLAGGALLPVGIPMPASGERRPWPGSRPAKVAATAVVAMLGAIAIDLWFQPLWAYDSWTFWTPKARALAQLGGLDASWFTSADLLNKDYPILLPALEAAGFRFTGYETPLLDLQSWLLLAAFVGGVAWLLEARAPRLVVWTVLAMVVFAPATVEQLAYAEADIPMAVFFALAGLGGALWLQERDARFAAVLALFAAATVATKVEGLIFVVVLLLVLAALALRRSLRLAFAVAGTGLIALTLSVLPWQLWLRAHDVESQGSLGRLTDVSFMLDHAGRLPHATAYVAVRVLDPTRWLLVVPLAALASWLAIRAGERELPLLAAATFLLSLAGVVLAYWTTPLDFDYHLATSARRVVSGPVLLLAVLTPLLASRAAADP
jgi:hypothetical protein